MKPNEDVVIVGAGPAGLAAAATLGSYGVSALLVERRESISTLPRANTISTATMELLRRWGLEERVRARGFDVEWTMLATPSLKEAASGEPVEVGLPTRGAAALVSPTHPAGVPQSEIEPILEDFVGSLPSVRIERGVELRSLDELDDGGFDLRLDGPAGESSVRSRHLIAADGIRGGVRSMLGIEAEEELLEEKLVVTFRAPAWDLVGDHRHVGYFMPDHPRGAFLIPTHAPDGWVLGRDWDQGADDLRAVTPETARAWIRECAGDHDLPIEIGTITTVSYGVALAKTFRRRGAFLAGDAAHRVTPRGGTGLNMAMRDGFDLGWKLAWVLRGWTDPSLLDSYERERRPVAEHNVLRSRRPDGSILGSAAGLAADIGGRIQHTWIARGESLISTLDLLGEGLTLFAGPGWKGWAPPSDPGSPPVAVERLDAIAARAIGLTPAGALLARPDGVAVALWGDADQVLGRRVVATGA